MLEIINLSKNFKDKQVLHDLSLKITEGTILGLIGINGAGKSTLLRLLSGIYKADNGHILYDGNDVYENEMVKKDIFLLPDEPFYDANSTPKNLINLYRAFYEFEIDEYLSYLKNFKIPLDKKINNFSKGMKRQVFVSLALAIKPKYLFLDEAFDGLDPVARLIFKRAIKKLVTECKSTIIISSHSLKELEDICDCYALIDNMKIASSGEITKENQNLHKFQIAFEELPNKEMFNSIDILSYEQEARVIKIVTNLSYNEFCEKIVSLKPLLIDEIAINFEELFVLEVGNRGYLE